MTEDTAGSKSSASAPRMVKCDYCGKPAALVGGEFIYAHRPDLFSKRFYLCQPCDAYVGCHKGTTEPLGRLANAELRAAKMAAHAVFDPIWQARLAQKQALDPKYSKSMARGGRYKKLAELMGMEQKDCHIGFLDVAGCERVVEICKSGALA